MINQIPQLQSAITEYESTLHTQVHHDPEILTDILCTNHEWTPRAAEILAQLAQDYGAFMLRNALALAIALNIEDGELDF